MEKSQNPQKPNWGHAYDLAVRETKDSLREARRESRGNQRTGRESHVYVPSRQSDVHCKDLTDTQIHEVALREAEKSTNSAINHWNERYSK